MGILDKLLGRRPEEAFGAPPGYPPPAYGPGPVPPPGMPPTTAVREMRVPAPEMLEKMEMTGAPPPGIPPGMPPPPPPPPYPVSIPKREEPRRLLSEDIEAITEKIVADRWKTLTRDFESLRKWRDETTKDMGVLGSKTKEIESKINNLEKELLAKIDQYSKGVSDISAEIKAIQKVFRATLPEFTHRVKELSALVERVKKTPKPRKSKRKTIKRKRKKK